MPNESGAFTRRSPFGRVLGHGRRALDLFNFVEEAQAAFVKRGAELGEADAAGRPIEQARAEPLFQRQDVFADCRRREP